jgi:hypothetical protein
MSAMWDDFQREILGALGHPPMVLAPRELPDDPLLHAMLRAAARDARADDLDVVLRALPATSSLRGNASGKRALWPQLRRFRRRTP